LIPIFFTLVFDFSKTTLTISGLSSKCIALEIP